MPPNVHGNKEDVKARPWFRIGDAEYSFYKSHRVDHAAMKPDVILYVYRHPLDVLLSTLRYKYRGQDARMFKDGIPKDVEDIHRDGEMRYYFDKFKNDLGRDIWPGLLGNTSDIKVHTSNINREKVIPIRYESLFEGREEYFKEKLLELFGEPLAEMDGLFDAVDKKTVATGKPFFWRARANTRREFFSEEMLDEFFSLHGDWLRPMGYGQ